MERAAAALDGGILTPEQAAEVLQLRIENWIWLGMMDNCAPDVEAVAALAADHASPALHARALIVRSMVQSRVGLLDEAIASARTALEPAARSADRELLALAHLRLATGLNRKGSDAAEALDYGRQAASAFESLGRQALRARALLVQFSALDLQGKAAEADALATEALALARQCGDPNGQASALNSLTFHEPDQAATLRRYQQALSALAAANNVSGRAVIIGNLGIGYTILGLFHRARRFLLEAHVAQARMGNKLTQAAGYWELFNVEFRMRHPHAARTAKIAAALTRELGSVRFAGSAAHAQGRMALRAGRAAEAAQLCGEAVELASEEAIRLAYLATAAEAHLAAGQPEQALAVTRRATELHRVHELAFLDGMDPPALWWRHAQALRANARVAESRSALEAAYRFLLELV
ncbi:MAG: hypothetical protein ABIS68_08020, partial [Casimicrobiaceae bacterium]